MIVEVIVTVVEVVVTAIVRVDEAVVVVVAIVRVVEVVMPMKVVASAVVVRVPMSTADVRVYSRFDGGVDVPQCEPAPALQPSPSKALGRLTSIFPTS